MNNKTFQELIENLRQHSSDVLLKKGNEYATEEDRLLNFKQAGVIWQLINPDAIKSKPRSVACFGMMLKHFVSIIDIINSKEPVSIELSYEKFGDIINYFHLLLSNIIDDGGIENTAYTQEKTRQSYVKSTEDWIQLKNKWKEEQEGK